MLLGKLDESNEGLIPATDLFPDLADPKKTPGITQKEMAKKIGVTQGDLSKMEKNERVIGKGLTVNLKKRYSDNPESFTLNSCYVLCILK